VITSAAVVVFAATYVLIMTERVHRTVAALIGAGLMLALKVISSEEAFHSTELGVDWEVIFLLLGMMLIVAVLRRTGLFEYVAIWSAKRARGRPFRIMVTLSVITAIASALLDNVTTVLLVAPVTILVAERLGVSAVPFLVAEIMASNIGGTATLVGDPPNIIIASEGGLSYIAFLANLGPIALIVLILFLASARVLFRGDLHVSPERVAEVMDLDEREAIMDRGLLLRALAVLALVTVGFLFHTAIGYEPATVALLGAGMLILMVRRRIGELLNDVEWSTLVFFMGLFVMVGSLIKVGTIDLLAREAAGATGGSVFVAAMLILVTSGVLSGFVDNIPYVAAMAPVVGQLTGSLAGGGPAGNVLWWALALGADLGGNLTTVGASANVVVVGIAGRAGSPIRFLDFLKYGSVVTALSIGVSALYLWLRYFVLR
jgi:Na+/H+ antiporter NhaD/arsenite permease-like protein